MSDEKNPFGEVICAYTVDQALDDGTLISIPIGIFICKFPLGEIVASPGALGALKGSEQSPFEFLSRHANGDWGDVDSEDWELNDRALSEGTRLLSAYRTQRDERIWVITEADRSVTTLLLPEEY